MIIALFVNSVAVLLSLLARYRNYRYFLDVAFVLITVFLSIRYMWGNDMKSYLDMYNLFNSVENNVFDLDSIDYRNGKEYGWIILNILCEPIGFFGMQILLAVFQNYVIYRFVKRYVSPNWYWFAVFIYGFNSDLMILSASMMRQFLAETICVMAIDYSIRKGWLKGVILVLLAASMHQSALMMLPFCFIRYVKLNLRTEQLFWILSGLSLWMLLGGRLMNGIVFQLISFKTFEDYSVYTGDLVELGTGLGILFEFLLACVALVHMGYMLDHRCKIIILMSSIMVLFVPLLSVAALISRLSFYFLIFTIVGYPLVFQSWRLGYFAKMGVLVVLIFLRINGFFKFFYSDIWHACYYEYHTIFEAPYWM